MKAKDVKKEGGKLFAAEPVATEETAASKLKSDEFYDVF